jgi:hypothetical protein
MKRFLRVASHKPTLLQGVGFVFAPDLLQAAHSFMRPE